VIKKDRENSKIQIIIQIQRIWHVKTKVIPVVLKASGTISESFRQYVSNVPEQLEMKALETVSQTGHSAHTSNSTNIEVQSIQRAK